VGRESSTPHAETTHREKKVSVFFSRRGWMHLLLLVVVVD
jgi:hypothetical protein